MVLWAVLTPLVLFLFLVPGYVVATYVKHRRNVSKERPGGRLLGNSHVSSYCTSRPTVREKLQERSSLNVPNAVKRTTKHLRSNSIIAAPNLQATKALLLQQQPSPSRHCRRNSSPISVHLVTPQHHPDILETYSPYQIQSAPASSDEKSPDEVPAKYEAGKRAADSNNNGARRGGGRRPRHLLPLSPNHFYTTTGAAPFIIPMKMEPLREALKVDLPEILDKP